MKAKEPAKTAVHPAVALSTRSRHFPHVKVEVERVFCGARVAAARHLYFEQNKTSYPVKTLTTTKESVSLIFRKPNWFAHVVKMERGLGGVCDGAGSIKKCRCDSLFNKLFICLGF